MPESNYSNKPTIHNVLNIWVVHDEKPGHLTQLIGLTSRLSTLTKTQLSWIPAKTSTRSIKILFKDKGSSLNKNEPAIILGAGHSTHKLVLQLAHKHRSISVLLMKPSLPTSLFDFIICPQHDGLTGSDRVFNTLGTINKVEPGQKTLEQRSNNLLLIGGPSKHFEWNEKTLISEIMTLCKHHADKQWQLSNSPRTPSTFMTELMSQEIPNLSCHQFNDEIFSDLNISLQNSAQTWVTPDSMSMLYESLTAGCATAVFTLSPANIKKPSRVALNVQQLISDKVISDITSLLNNENSTLTTEKIWEADRAAQWLLKQCSQSHQLGREIPV